MKRIFLVDCPGVVYPTGDSETELVLKGVVRVENIGEAIEHIPTVLERVKKEYVSKTYRIDHWEDHYDFLAQFARKTGKLLKVQIAIHICEKFVSLVAFVMPAWCLVALFICVMKIF
jgi:ribosome biogenesis GTPase A